ncbi:hypothetical protein PR048_028099 [Dryococelus australis]|uniref:Uncharacterized protein n=1 Tax=Dryococelus australis TaxID=614101 RepID=A0ABQ9GIB0_9NEOP|nr:hypothetical protein PR048_028099 [Dryococelus australis]
MYAQMTNVLQRYTRLKFNVFPKNNANFALSEFPIATISLFFTPPGITLYRAYRFQYWLFAIQLSAKLLCFNQISRTVYRFDRAVTLPETDFKTAHLTVNSLYLLFLLRLRLRITEAIRATLDTFFKCPIAECTRYYGWKHGERGLCRSDTAPARRPEMGGVSSADMRLVFSIRHHGQGEVGLYITELRRSAQQAFSAGVTWRKTPCRRPALPSYRRGITQHGLIPWLVEGIPAHRRQGRASTDCGNWLSLSPLMPVHAIVIARYDKDGADFPDVPKHLSNYFPPSSGVKESDGENNTGCASPEDHNKLVSWLGLFDRCEELNAIFVGLSISTRNSRTDPHETRPYRTSNFHYWLFVNQRGVRLLCLNQNIPCRPMRAKRGEHAVALECKGGGSCRSPRKSRPSSGIIRHDPQTQKSGFACVGGPSSLAYCQLNPRNTQGSTDDVRLDRLVHPCVRGDIPSSKHQADNSRQTVGTGAGPQVACQQLADMWFTYGRPEAVSQWVSAATHGPLMALTCLGYNWLRRGRPLVGRLYFPTWNSSEKWPRCGTLHEASCGPQASAGALQWSADLNVLRSSYGVADHSSGEWPRRAAGKGLASDWFLHVVEYFLLVGLPSLQVGLQELADSYSVVTSRRYCLRFPPTCCFLSQFEVEKLGSDKGENAARVKCAIAAKPEHLDYRSLAVTTKRALGRLKYSTLGGNPENTIITKSGDKVCHCSSESIVYIQNSVTPLDCQRIKEYGTLSEDCEASRAVQKGGEKGGGGEHNFEFVSPRLITSARLNTAIVYGWKEHLKINQVMPIKPPCDLLKRCRERKINIKASERVNVDPPSMAANLKTYLRQKCKETGNRLETVSCTMSEEQGRCGDVMLPMDTIGTHLLAMTSTMHRLNMRRAGRIAVQLRNAQIGCAQPARSVYLISSLCYYVDAEASSRQASLSYPRVAQVLKGREHTGISTGRVQLVQFDETWRDIGQHTRARAGPGVLFTGRSSRHRQTLWKYLRYRKIIEYARALFHLQQHRGLAKECAQDWCFSDSFWGRSTVGAHLGEQLGTMRAPTKTSRFVTLLPASWPRGRKLRARLQPDWMF